MSNAINVPLQINVIISKKTGSDGITFPIIELRRKIEDKELLKSIISAAYHKRPIIVQPYFIKELSAVNSLIEKGLLYYDKEGQEFRFTF